jgi:pimeloyl-ACP methyl ester carboxylesterase
MTKTAHEPWLPVPGADDGYAQFHKDRRVVVDDGTTIAYTVRNPEGPAQPLLFANGWSCSDSYWVDLVPRFVAAGHPCVIPDTRGHGASGLPRDPGRGAKRLRPDDLSIPRMAADLLAVLDDTSFPHAVVVGHSMGVQTALEAYRAQPAKVLALVLLAGTYENPLQTFYGSSLPGRAFPLMKAAMRWTPEVAWPLWSTIGNAKVGHAGARLARAAGAKTTPEALHPYLLHLRNCDPAVLVLAADAMRRHSAADLLGRIQVPVLIAAAGKDVFTPRKCSDEMARRIPGAELVLYPEAAHTLPIEEDEAIAEATADFLTRRLAEPSAGTPPERAKG